jgi:hypothetical protein
MTLIYIFIIASLLVILAVEGVLGLLVFIVGLIVIYLWEHRGGKS